MKRKHNHRSVRLSAVLMAAGALTFAFGSAEAQVTKEWHKPYPAAAGTADFKGVKVVTDGMGNSYVLGEKEVSNTNTDIVVVKYKSDGTIDWEAGYDGTFGHDIGTDLTIDGGGNIYVAGYSKTSATTYSSYIVIKYNPFGKELWKAFYDNGGATTNEASAIAVDADGNVFVTGGSRGTGTNQTFDYATVKYNSAGDQAWAKRYTGLGFTDKATCIAIDNNNHVWVSGASEGSAHQGGQSVATPSDIVTIRYNATDNSSTPEFVDRYDGGYGDDGVAMGIDNSGNVYVTGSKAIDADYISIHAITIKYNSNISQNNSRSWSHVYSGNGLVQPRSIAVDGSANVYVAGYSRSGTGYDDYVTIKYSPGSSNSTVWVKTYNPSNGYDEVNSVALDNSGNVYVTGGNANNGSRNYHTIRYNPSGSGSEVWGTSYNGGANGLDIANSVAVDNYGNVWVTGYSVETGSTKTKMTTIKYTQPNFPSMPTLTEADFWMHDSGHDIGNEPNYESETMAGWKNYFGSPDLWNRWYADGGIDPQPADYAPTYGNYLYVRIYNMGGKMISSEPKLHLYWTRARLGEIWDEHWTDNVNNRTSAGHPMGLEVTPFSGTTPIGIDMPGIPPGKSQLVKLKWFPPNPLWYTNDGFLFTTKNNRVYPQLCYLARVVSTADPMHLEHAPSLKKEIIENVRNNNNIATKNSWIGNETSGPNSPIPVVTVNNVATATRNLRIRFRPVNQVQGQPGFQNYGFATLVLDESLWIKWLNGGQLGSGFQVIAPGLIRMTNSTEGVTLDNLIFDAGEAHDIGVEFTQETNTPAPYSYEFAMTCTAPQYPNEDLRSGQNYRVNLSPAPVPIISDAPEKSAATGMVTLSSQPEPFSGSAMLSYSLTADTKVTISVHNLLGKPVQMLASDEFRSAGSYSLSLNAENLPAGVYLITVETGYGSVTKRVTVLK